MSVVALIRPDSWNFPLFLHVLGAMVLFGAVAAAVGTLLTPGGGGDPAGLRRFAFRMLLFVGPFRRGAHCVAGAARFRPEPAKSIVTAVVP